MASTFINHFCSDDLWSYYKQVYQYNCFSHFNNAIKIHDVELNIRQIRETVTWVFSEPMLHYYIQLFTKSWWPNGHLVSVTTARTDEEKLKTRGEARRQFLNNVPVVLTNLVGAQSGQRGAIKIFDSLQNVNLNKQLFYVSYPLL